MYEIIQVTMGSVFNGNQENEWYAKADQARSSWS